MGIVSPRDNLTQKMRKVVIGKLAGMSHSQIGRYAYPNTKYPKQMATQMVQHPDVQSAIQKALKETGVTPERMALVLSDGLSATHQDFEGNEKVDYTTRHKYLDTALKVSGGYAPEKRMNLNATTELDSILEAMEKRNG